MTDPVSSIRKGDGLVLVDVQRDFCPGGALPIEEGDRIVPILNRWVEAFCDRNFPVYASRDWHPDRHLSFEEEGGPWPPHCIQDSPGAEFHPDLKLPDNVVKISKGARFDHDQNSIFDETGLTAQLERDGVTRLWVGGLAQDVCVLASVLDARKTGIEVCLLRDATRPVTAKGGEEAIQRMEAAGAHIVTETG
jgi:nicotinamidase/pyrazinamidase